MPGGTIRGSSPVRFVAQVLAPSVGVGASRGTAADVGEVLVLAINAGPRLMLAPSVGVGASRGTAADGDEALQFTKSRVLRRRLSRFSPKDHQLPNFPTSMKIAGLVSV